MKTKRIDVFLLPTLLGETDLSGGVAVVIDVLRATTTITHAIAHKADCVVPLLNVDDAKEEGARQPAALLGGERGGQKIDGFDLGNSPAEYPESTVAGKKILFTTTNGTKAMQACRTAQDIYIAAFVNLTAVCNQLADCPHIFVVCAGTTGEITREDVLLAGAIVDVLSADALKPIELNDQAQIAADAWLEAKTGLTATTLADRLKKSRGGRNVLRLGLDNDIDIAAALDKFDVVPKLNPKTWEIRDSRNPAP
ncbi:putative 2-phosphosulfolactate phosphatase [Bremerella volcania]|uniref:Probable 2-phosphosulfolactate phosphatase n=1 Tax=Bremerella volcania TaxID=2527984 RepID=A0A518C4T8_9BACT|nr:2-phosphosulfolactate phosphatase [Bremerella volcania]QDU74252.1 putative 2-phosphosulfolactate phosphatase [Bremerella volcania]